MPDHPTGADGRPYCTQGETIQRMAANLEILTKEQHRFNDRLLTMEVSGRVERAVEERYERSRINGKNPVISALGAIPPWGWVVIAIVRGPELVEVLIRYLPKLLGGH